MSNIIWLASYPKSGNTWFRTFLSHLLKEQSEDVSINHMKTDGIFSSRHIVDEITGIKTSNLTEDEIDQLRPIAYNYLATKLEKPLYIKAHDAYTYINNGTPLLGTVNAKAIYILRNPLDVAVSFASHLSKDLDETIQCMGNDVFCLSNSKTKAQTQLRQKLLSWSGHAKSWAKATELPVHFIRYEDMKENPLETFTAAVQFIGLDCSSEQISQAIEASDFKKLKAEELKNGFKEKPYHTASFFRSGKVGDWKNHLSNEQRDQIIEDQETAMKIFGYIDDYGNLVY